MRQEFTRGSNWNLGAGLSIVLMVFILLSMTMIAKYDKGWGGICILMKTARERFKKFIEDFYLVLVLVFLYAPILVMMVLSFNSSKSRSQWGGFTLKWYTQMFESATIMDPSIIRY